MRAFRSLTFLAASAALVLVASSAGAAKNYTMVGKFTSNRGKSAQVPLVGLNTAGTAINGCGGLTLMSGPGVAGTVTPTVHPNMVGVNHRGLVPKDLGCVPQAKGAVAGAGKKIVTTGKGVGGQFTLPVVAFKNPSPPTTINAIAITTLPGFLQFATSNSVTGPPAVRLEAPMGTMNNGTNTAAFRVLRTGAFTSQTGRAAAKFAWCPPVTFNGMGVPMCPNIAAGGFPMILKYNGTATAFGGTMSYLTHQVSPGSLARLGQGGPQVTMFGTVGQNGMAVSLVTGRGYASHHVDALLSATIHSTFALMTVPRPIVGPQKLITMLGMPVGMGIGGVAHGWGFPLTTRTVLVRNTGTLGGGPHNTTFTAKGYDCVNRKGRFGGGVITANGCGTALTGMNNRNISLVAGQIGVGSFAGGAFNVPTIAMVNSFLPEPGRTLQMLAGVVGLLGIAAWRSRRSR